MKEILVVDGSKERVRVLSVDYVLNQARVERCPCECAQCTVGYTDLHHKKNTTENVSLDILSFPVYGYLHYWDDGPVKDNFMQKSGTRVSSWL